MSSPALDHAAVLAFLRERFPDAGNLNELDHGEWSRAYGFTADELDLVVRFGHHLEDYEKDRLAADFASSELPIPGVFEIGEAFDGVYSFAPRAFGQFIEAQGLDGFRATLPSLFRALDALRDVEPPGSGFGWWAPGGDAPFDSWNEFLLDVSNDHPGSRTEGWRDRLATRPAAEARFAEGVAALEESVEGLPEVRHVVHTDLVAANVIVDEGEIAAVLDWGNAIYGDFVYDLAHIAFWLPWFPGLAAVDLAAEAAAHYEASGVDVPAFEERLRCCMVRIGLDAQAYDAFTDRWEELDQAAARTLEVAGT
jgi:hygromycin-B 4-O-kinase